MKTDFYKLLEIEDQPHLIFAHVHRRKNELEIALRKLGCDFDVKKATDEELLDLTTIDAFFASLSDFSLPRLFDSWTENRNRDLADLKTAHSLGSKLSCRVMGISGSDGGYFEYIRLIEPSAKKLRYLRDSEVKAANEVEAARLAAEDAKLAAEKAAAEGEIFRDDIFRNTLVA